MSQDSHYLAFDLGASSGRAVLGSFDGERLTIDEIHRFANGPIERGGHLHWDAATLFGDIKRGLQESAAHRVRLDGIGIDTWGVDYALLSAAGDLVDLPFHYRDKRTNGVMEQVLHRVPREEVYSRTGIQFMPINTLYQLASERPEALRSAQTLLFMPDLFNFWLSGVRTSERSIASTSQMFDGARNVWSVELLRAIDFPTGILPAVAAPATVIGPLLPAICGETGMESTPVIAPACHDTACAVAAVPAQGSGWAYISSGTWSLVGLEVAEPLRTPAAMHANLTNEAGAAGTTRLLRNVTGLWLIQECQRVWESAGSAISHELLATMAAGAPPLASLIDPDDPRFSEPCDMPARIRDWCRESGQPVPQTPGAVVRCALESLALKSRIVLDVLAQRTSQSIHTVHMVGGGARNELLCQFTANALGRRVVAGPIEATAIGNIMLQAMARGRVETLAGIRNIVARSFRLQTYEPSDGAAWENAVGQFRALLRVASPPAG